jgi:16S rRNA (adenine1518-N6/adenine1519-N6)-dimethyltransferase
MDGLDLQEEHLREVLGVAGGQCADDAAAGAEQSKGGEVPDARDGVSSHGSDAEGLHAPAGQGDAARALPNKLVSNLPYAVAATIVLDYLQRFEFLQSATVMVQKEVADRMCAGPGSKDYGSLSVAVQYYSAPRIVEQVPPSSFLPHPKVTSAIVTMDLYEEPPVQAADEHLFDAIVRAAFEQRRKTLVNALSSSPAVPYGKKQVQDALASLGLDASIRGEKLSIPDFARFSDRLAETGTAG